MRMYDDQCKVDRDGGDSDASSCEQTTGRDSVHSPIGSATSPLKFNRSRGKSIAKSFELLLIYCKVSYVYLFGNTKNAFSH